MAPEATIEPGEPTSGLGWLALVLPAGARRVRTADSELAQALSDAGGELVDDRPDVEIVLSAQDACVDAPLAIVVVDPPVRTSPFVAVRLARRIAGSVATRVRAARARRGLRRRGYTETSVLLWDLRQRVRVEDVPAYRSRLVERLPTRALAIGRGADTGQSALRAVLADVAQRVGAPLDLRWISIRSGVLLAESDRGILRVAIGPGRIQILNQAAALEALGRDDPPATVADRVPWLRASGRVGLADWSLERMLPGRRPRQALTASLTEECREFLVALHQLAGGDVGGPTAADLAETVAEVCGTEGTARLRQLVARLDAELAGVQRGFAHGDFFAGNLLAVDGRLTGVFDWDAAGPGRPPLVDLFHLQLAGGGYGSDDEWGAALLERLLPAVREGGGEQVERYCSDVGLDPDPGLLEALALSYWLGYIAYQLHTHPTRRSEPRWIEKNVERVLRDLESRVGRR